MVREVCSTFLSRKFPEGADVINVNIPSRLTGRYEVTRLSHKLFLTGVEKRLDPRGRPYFWINGPLVGDDKEGTDVHAIRKGNVSLTPITLDCTAPEANSELGSLFSAPSRDFSGCTREGP